MVRMGWAVLLAAMAVLPVGAESPNIVLIFGDDLGRHASAYRDPARPDINDIVVTPNMDRLAREGTLFLNAFVNVPSCTPCRASLVSGRYFFRNGSHSQLHSPWIQGAADPWKGAPGFPLRLADAGYHIGWTYKMHISEDRMGGPGRNYRKSGSRFNNYSENLTSAKDPAAEKVKLLNEISGNFDRFLKDRKPNQPFFYWFNPTNTHRTWVKGSGKKLWGLDPDSLKGKLPAFLPDVPEVREDLTDYLGEVQAFDAAVGVILARLEQAGELDRTLVVVSGDHGAPGFTHGKCTLYDFGTRVPLILRQPGAIAAGRKISEPVSLLDLAPTFLEHASAKPLPEVNGQSLMPLVRPGARPAELRPRPFVIHGREVHFHTARAGNLPYPSRAIRTADHLYIVNFHPDRYPMGDPMNLAKPTLPDQKTLEFNTGVGYADMDAGPFKAWMVQNAADPRYAPFAQWAFGKRPAEELYRISDDPDQVVNLADRADLAMVKKELRERLFAELRANNDPRLDGDRFDLPPYLVSQIRK